MKTVSDNITSTQPAETTATVHDVLIRVESEYKEMPGMCVTRLQAQRLLGLDSTTCELVLTALLERGVLRRTSRDTYVKC